MTGVDSWRGRARPGMDGLRVRGARRKPVRLEGVCVVSRPGSPLLATTPTRVPRVCRRGPSVQELTVVLDILYSPYSRRHLCRPCPRVLSQCPHTPGQTHGTLDPCTVHKSSVKNHCFRSGRTLGCVLEEEVVHPSLFTPYDPSGVLVVVPHRIEPPVLPPVHPDSRYGRSSSTTPFRSLPDPSRTPYPLSNIHYPNPLPSTSSLPRTPPPVPGVVLPSPLTYRMCPRPSWSSLCRTRTVGGLRVVHRKLKFSTNLCLLGGPEGRM